MPEGAERLVNVHGLAEHLRLPAIWLRKEALAGRIPALRVGHRYRFNPLAVEHALLERAADIPTQRGAAPTESPRAKRRPRQDA